LFRCPDTCPVKERMIYAATNDALKKKLGVSKSKEYHDCCDLDYQDITQTLKKGK